MPQVEHEAELGKFLDDIELATWNQPRSSEFLAQFIDQRHQLLPAEELAVV